MTVVGNDDPVLHRVAADDAAGGNVETEDRIAGRRQLMHELLGGRTAIVDPGIVLLQDDHAAALDTLVPRIDRRRDEVGERHVRDEAAPLLDVQDRFLSLFPLLDADLATQHAGVDAHVRNGLRQRESAPLDRPVLAGLRRREAPHILVFLLRRPLLVDRRQTEVARHRAGGRAAVHPRQLERRQRQRQVLGAGDKAAVLGLQKDRRDARRVVRLEQRVLLFGPLVGVPCSLGDEPRHRPTGHRPHRLHQHLEVVAVGETPHDLADVVAGQRGQLRHFGGIRFYCAHTENPFDGWDGLPQSIGIPNSWETPQF